MRFKEITLLSLFLLLCTVVLTVDAFADKKDMGKKKAEVSGVVSSIVGDSIGLINDTIVVDASTAWIKLESCWATVDITDIEVGDYVEAKANNVAGSLVATEVKFKGAGKIGGTITNVGAGFIEVEGQVVDISSTYCTSGTPQIGKKAEAYVRDDGNGGLTGIVVKVKNK